MSRAQQMARIRATNTEPERLLRSALWRGGLRYRLHARSPGGRPDLLFKGSKVAVFVDGCFWHGCPEHYVRPRSGVDFWATKLTTNVERDIRQTAALEGQGWRVCRLWEHEVHERLPAAVRAVRNAVLKQIWQPVLNWRVLKVDALAAGDMERRFLVELRGKEAQRVVERKRSTVKWSRAKR